MKTLTRDEFESLVTSKTPSAELPDGSDIDLTVDQAMRWYDMFNDCSRPSFILVISRWVFIGEGPETAKETGMLYQIGGTK